MEVVTRRHGEMKKSLEGYKVEVDKLRSDMKEREDDLSEEKTKRHLSDSKRRAAEQAVITLKQQCKEMEAEQMPNIDTPRGNTALQEVQRMRKALRQYYHKANFLASEQAQSPVVQRRRSMALLYGSPVKAAGQATEEAEE